MSIRVPHLPQPRGELLDCIGTAYKVVYRDEPCDGWPGRVDLLRWDGERVVWWVEDSFGVDGRHDGAIDRGMREWQQGMWRADHG